MIKEPASFLIGCEEKHVGVVDAKTGQPIGGAEVYAKYGKLRTGSAVTDGSGWTYEPEHPYEGSDLVIKRPGYRTVTIPRYE